MTNYICTDRRSVAAGICLVASLALASPAAAHGRHPQQPPPDPETRACGAGTLGFGAPVQLAPRTHPPVPAFVFADLLNADDQNIDVGVARGNRLAAILGDGHGGFRRLAPVEVGRTAFLIDVATADLNADGINDAVLVDALQPSALRVVRGTADGRLAGPQQRVFLDHFDFPRGAVAADLDDDGFADVAVASYADKELVVLLGRSSRSGHAEFSRTEVKLPLHPVELAHADVDGDGAPDLVAASARGNLAVVLNRGGDFSQETPLYIPMHSKPWSTLAGIAAADLNGDGRVDLLSLLAQGTLSVRLAEDETFPPADVGVRGEPVFPSSGPPRFSNPMRGKLPCAGNACGYAAVAVGDVDRDGWRDLVVGARDVQVMFGRGDGTFARGPSLSAPGWQVGDVRLAELNGDRRLDVIVGAYDGSVSVISSDCACSAPFSGPECDSCVGDARCPGSASEQLAVGPAAIVQLGAQLAARSLTPPTDPRSAARLGQELAALGLESDAIVVAQPLRDRSELAPNGDDSIPFTITSFAVERLLIGPQGLQDFEIAQEGGAVGDLVVENSNAIPFPTADDFAICPEATHAESGPHWLLFLTAMPSDRSGTRRLRLLGDLTPPALQVVADAGQFVLLDQRSGVSLPADALAAVLGGTR